MGVMWSVALHCAFFVRLLPDDFPLGVGADFLPFLPGLRFSVIFLAAIFLALVSSIIASASRLTVRSRAA